MRQNYRHFIMFVFVVTVICAFIYYICHIWNAYGYWRRRGVVGPTPWPIVGNYGPVLFRLKKESKLLQEFYNKYPEEEYVGLFIGTKPVLLIRDPNIVKIVLTTDFDMFPNRFINFFTEDFRQNIFTIDCNEEWKNMRKAASFALTKTSVCKTIPAIESLTRKYYDYTKECVKLSSDQNISVLKRGYMFKLTQDFLINKEEEAKEAIIFNNKYIRIDRLVNLLNIEISNISEHVFPFIFTILKPLTKFATMQMKNYFTNIIKNVLQIRSKADESQCFRNGNIDFLSDVKLNDKNNFIIDNFLVQKVTSYIFSTLSIQNQLIFMTYNLAMNPKMQEKCYEEITEVLKRYDGKYTAKSLSEMKYLKMIVDETLRIQVQHYLIERTCKTRYRIPGSNVVIDENVHVYIPHECLHMDPKYFPKPEEFIPERFSSENNSKILPYTYFPFGEGPRICLGKDLVKTVMMVEMATFLEKFRVAPSNLTPRTIEYDFSVRNKTFERDLWLSVQNRNPN